MSMETLRELSVSERFDRRLAVALVACSVIFSLVPFTLSMGATGPEATHQLADGSHLRQFQFGSVFFGAAWLAWKRRDWTVRHLRHVNPFLLLVVAYCFASMLWSAAPMVSLKRSVLLAGLLLIGLATAPPVGAPRQCMRVLMVTLTGLVGISALVAIAIPSVGIDYDLGGAWRGIMWQKNVLGSIAGFALMLWIREFLMRETFRWRASAGILLNAFVLVMSKSTTALLVTVLGIGIYLLFRRRYLAGKHTGAILSLGLGLIVVLSLFAYYLITGHLPQWSELVGPITSILHKSADLTGRDDIWRLVLISVRQHPIWGIGYGAFWLGDGSPAQYIADILSWMPAHAHNGYIDILNELGVVGLALTLAMLIYHFYQIARLFDIDREEASIHLAFVLLILLSNVSESQLLADVNFQNILLFYSSLTISARLDVHQQRGILA